MKVFEVLFAALLVACAPSVLAQVNITHDEGVTIHLINEEEPVKQPNKGSGYTGRSGLNQLVVQYTATVKVSGDDHELESTNAFVLLLESESSFHIKAPALKNDRSVKKFNANPNWQVSDATGKRLSVKVSPLIKEGFQLARNYQQEVSQFNRTMEKASLANVAYTNRSEVNAQQAIIAPVSLKRTSYRRTGNTELPEVMLNYWYQQASPETRKRFISAISEKH